ncbi:MAG: CdaR family protein [bacterium]
MKIFKDIDIKIILFLVTILLWLFVASGQNRIDFLPGKLVVEAQGLKDGLVGVFSDDLIKIKISAPKGLWEDLNNENFAVFVDVRNKKIGTYEMEVLASCSIPGVQILEVTPAQVLVKVEPAVQARLPITIQTKGSLAKDYTIGELTTDPSEVLVEGAGSVVDSLVTATTILNLSGEQNNINRNIEIVALDEESKQIRHLKFEPEKVKVKAMVVKGGVAKIVGINPKIIGSPTSGFWVSNIEFEPSTLKVTGSSERLENLEYLVADLDVTGADENFDKKIIPKIPTGVTLLKGEPETVLAKVSVSRESSIRTINAGVLYNGLEGRGLSVSSTTPDPLDIKVIVSGPISVLSALTSQNVVVNIDLFDKGIGDHKIEIKKSMISIPSSVSIASYLPSHISITISEI